MIVLRCLDKLSKFIIRQELKEIALESTGVALETDVRGVAGGQVALETDVRGVALETNVRGVTGG